MLDYFVFYDGKCLAFEALHVASCYFNVDISSFLKIVLIIADVGLVKSCTLWCQLLQGRALGKIQCQLNSVNGMAS
jgi:hypothetical protein